MICRPAFSEFSVLDGSTVVTRIVNICDMGLRLPPLVSTGALPITPASYNGPHRHFPTYTRQAIAAVPSNGQDRSPVPFVLTQSSEKAFYIGSKAAQPHSPSATVYLVALARRMPARQGYRVSEFRHRRRHAAKSRLLPDLFFGWAPFKHAIHDKADVDQNVRRRTDRKVC